MASGERIKPTSRLSNDETEAAVSLAKVSYVSGKHTIDTFRGALDVALNRSAPITEQNVRTILSKAGIALETPKVITDKCQCMQELIKIKAWLNSNLDAKL